jgi:hypothetical protein
LHHNKFGIVDSLITHAKHAYEKHYKPLLATGIFYTQLLMKVTQAMTACIPTTLAGKL